MGDEKNSKKIYETHATNPKPADYFKSGRHAKKILAKVALDFFSNGQDSSVDKFEAFIKGTLVPKFVFSLTDVGYFPDPINGYFQLAVLVKKDDSEEVKYEKWNRVLAVVQPSTGDYFNRTLIRIWHDFYNEEERKELEEIADKEILEENKSSDTKDNKAD